ncbi:restriction endonuclease [Yinghuangia seranimata]|uniref:restriction endonuclease n=1 Tax=Yinghuangia seranimata TaxID=408067 RepID=UPI00248C8D37|nr:restriction endonuclease [Yinghuangia seranimata]MDI2130225.1 restriction endonuclease [Yinghuangia seranimata]
MTTTRRTARGNGTTRTARSTRVPAPRRTRPGGRRPSGGRRPRRTGPAARVYATLTIGFCVAAGIAGYLRAWQALFGILSAAAFVLVLVLGTRWIRNGLRTGWRRRGQDARRRIARSLAAVDAMDGTAFEHHVAALCERDGCTRVQVSGGAGDLGADVTGRLYNGRFMVIQCKRYAPDRAVGSPDMQRFVGTARPVHNAEVALFVTSTRFTTPARDLARGQRIIAIDRDLLGLWMNGTPLASVIAMTATSTTRA